jgi:rfaE bifunctional protein nucleotidyltransferase chain/domain
VRVQLDNGDCLACYHPGVTNAPDTTGSNPARPWRASSEKVVDLHDLAMALDPVRAAGQRIVMTNGAFDLLHVGHLHSLERARALGDLLVVGVNSDASIHAYKAPNRPILPERERAMLIAGLGCVDYVVIFDNPTAERLAEAIRPDVYVKGADYSVKFLPERAVVEAIWKPVGPPPG